MPGLFLCVDCERFLTEHNPKITAAEPPLLGVCSLFHYGDVLQSLLHTYKYNGVFALKETLGYLIQKHKVGVPEQWFVDAVIVPVPLHAKRYRERGFNQAEDIAQILGLLFEARVERNLLTKPYATNAQARLNKVERLQNVRGSFHLNRVIPKGVLSVVLVDDVYTTGATLLECAKTLHRKYPNVKIYAITIGRG